MNKKEDWTHWPPVAPGKKYSNSVIRSNRQLPAELRYDLVNRASRSVSLQLALVNPRNARPALWVELGTHILMEDWEKPREVTLFA